MNGRLFFIAIIILSVVIGFGSCEGDQGPIGPAGPTGDVGPVGATGQNGAENCINCHGGNQVIAAKMFQWENSLHAIGGNYDRNEASCAACHTSQGFVERITAGIPEPLADVDDPLPQNCYTCHKIHQTYTEEDWALTSEDPVTFWVGGETIDLGKGNLCINCHQTRLREPAVPNPSDMDSVSITSPFWGPHHGAQGAMFTGSSAFEVPGTSVYENSLHTSLIGGDNGCIKCHMAKVMDGRASGGHTFRVTSEDGVLNTNGCIDCHTDTDELQMMVDNTHFEIDALLEELKNELVNQGILAEQFGSFRAVPGTYTPTEVGVLWNYLYVEEDKSGGVHNYKYAKALLENSIEALQ